MVCCATSPRWSQLSVALVGWALPGIEGGEADTVSHHTVEEGVGMGDEREALSLEDGRRSSEQDGREGEGEWRSELVEVMEEALASGVVTWTVQEHVLDCVDGDRGRRVDG